VTNLAAVMSVVRDGRTYESHNVGPAIWDVASGCQGALNQANHRARALPEGFFGFGHRHLGAVELRRRILVPGGHLEPHASDVVHVGEGCGDVPPLGARGLRAPDVGAQRVEQHLVDALVRQEGLDQRPPQFDGLPPIPVGSNAAGCARFLDGLFRHKRLSAVSKNQDG
jgi:hypothetical protein